MPLVTIDRATFDDGSIDESLHDSSDSHSVHRNRSASVDFFLWHSCATELNNLAASPRRNADANLAPECEHLSVHLKRILGLLRPEHRIKMAVRMQNRKSIYNGNNLYRYLCLIAAPGTTDSEIEEHAIIGADVEDRRTLDCNECMTVSESSSPPTINTTTTTTTTTTTNSTEEEIPATIGLVEPVWQDLQVKLDGDGGFKMFSRRRELLFKPVSIRALWSAVQHISSAIEHARASYHHGSALSHTWLDYYAHYINKTKQVNVSRVLEWIRTDDIQMSREELVPLTPKNPTERQAMEAKIYEQLRHLMYSASVDIDDLTVAELRKSCEEHFGCSLKDYREFISETVLTLYGQLDKASEIFPFLFLGSTYNASNLEELQKHNISHILNVTKEIDNFFADMEEIFTYKNIRVHDEEDTVLLNYWQETHEFINSARDIGKACLVHCKMGVSRSASTVIAYIMKENNWSMDEAFNYVKKRRECISPNPGFTNQLKMYEGMIRAHREQRKLRYSPSDPTTTRETKKVQQQHCPAEAISELIASSTPSRSLTQITEMPSDSTFDISMTNNELVKRTTTMDDNLFPPQPQPSPPQPPMIIESQENFAMEIISSSYLQFQQQQQTSPTLQPPSTSTPTSQPLLVTAPMISISPNCSSITSTSSSSSSSSSITRYPLGELQSIGCENGNNIHDDDKAQLTSENNNMDLDDNVNRISSLVSASAAAPAAPAYRLDQNGEFAEIRCCLNSQLQNGNCTNSMTQTVGGGGTETTIQQQKNEENQQNQDEKEVENDCQLTENEKENTATYPPITQNCNENVIEVQMMDCVGNNCYQIKKPDEIERNGSENEEVQMRNNNDACVNNEMIVSTTTTTTTTRTTATATEAENRLVDAQPIRPVHELVSRFSDHLEPRNELSYNRHKSTIETIAAAAADANDSSDC